MEHSGEYFLFVLGNNHKGLVGKEGATLSLVNILEGENSKTFSVNI